MAKKTIFVVILALISLYPLLHKGLPPTHDGEYHIVRFYEFYKTLSDGNLYPRWAPDLNNGFGVPIFNYVYPFPNYVSSFVHMLGVSFIDSFKLNMFVASLVGALFFFLWSRKFWGDLGGVVSSVFYNFSPYHLLDIYIRGSVGEVWALALLPGFLWSVTEYKEGKKIFGTYSSVLFALIIFSHNILALMLSLFCFAYSLIIFGFRKKSLLKIFTIFVLGIGLSSIFWLPALAEKNLVRGLEVYDYSSNFPEFYQLIIPSWGSGFSGGDLQNELSFQVGIANLTVIFFSFFILLKKKLRHRSVIIFSLFSFIIVFFLMLKASEFIWKIIPLFNYFQFPWRFLSIEIVVCSFLAGGLLIWKRKLLSVILILLAISLGIGYTGFAYYHQREDNYYIKRSNFIDGTNSPGNAFNTLWAANLVKQKQKIVIKEGKISDLRLGSTEYNFRLSSEIKQKVLINTAYFPGWFSYIDGNKKIISIEKRGNFSFIAPPGSHYIQIKFEDTPIRKLSFYLTSLSFLILLLNLYRFVKIEK